MAWHHVLNLAGAVLKKRFDDIFDSARYTKALDVLNKQKKGLASKALQAARWGHTGHEARR